MPRLMCETEALLGLALKLDWRVMAELMVQSGLAPPREQPTCHGMVLGETALPLLDAFKRLVELLDEPDTIPVLAPLIQREIFFRLLVSNQGMRVAGICDGQLKPTDRQSDRLAKVTTTPIHLASTNWPPAFR